VITLLYFDMRVRKEGFDLQLLADGLGTTRDPDAPLPAPVVSGEQPQQWWRDQARDEATYGGFTRPEAEEPPPWRRDASGLPMFPSADNPPDAGGWSPPGGAGEDAQAAPGDAEGSPTGGAGGVPAAPGDAGGLPAGGAGDAPAEPGDASGSPRGGAGGVPAAPEEPSRPGGAGGSSAPPDAPGGSPASADDPARPGFAGDSPAPPDAPGDSSREDEPKKRDPKRADWLPPEAPRGPGGL
jgi:hypothetical protein